MPPPRLVLWPIEETEALELSLQATYLPTPQNLWNYQPTPHIRDLDSLFQTFDTTKTDYSEPWINCIRLSKLCISEFQSSCQHGTDLS
jgi:hypothetical protein